MEREADFFEQLAEDGRPALMLFAVGLLISGAFAVFLSARRESLPHDVAFLGMTAKELCDLADCRVVRFMFHDRVAFGGSLMATDVLYLWLAVFPLRNGERWAWWAFALSGILRVRRRGSRLHGIDAGDAAGGESAAGPAHRARSRRLRRRTGHDRTAGAVLRLARPPEPIIPPGRTAGSRLVRFQARARVTVAIEYASARG